MSAFNEYLSRVAYYGNGDPVFNYDDMYVPRQVTRDRRARNSAEARIATDSILDWLEFNGNLNTQDIWIDPGLVLVLADSTVGKTAFMNRVLDSYQVARNDASHTLRYELGEPEVARPFPITRSAMTKFLLRLRYSIPAFSLNSAKPIAVNGFNPVVERDSYDRVAQALARDGKMDVFDISTPVGSERPYDLWCFDSFSFAYASEPVAALPPTTGGFPTGLAQFLFNDVHCVAKARGVVVVALMNPLFFEKQKIESLVGHISGLISLKTVSKSEREEIQDRLERGERVPFKASFQFNVTSDTDIMLRPRTSDFLLPTTDSKPAKLAVEFGSPSLDNYGAI